MRRGFFHLKYGKNIADVPLKKAVDEGHRGTLTSDQHAVELSTRSTFSIDYEAAHDLEVKAVGYRFVQKVFREAFVHGAYRGGVPNIAFVESVPLCFAKSLKHLTDRVDHGISPVGLTLNAIYQPVLSLPSQFCQRTPRASDPAPGERRQIEALGCRS
ncbi:hypothetical protein SAMN05216228_10554 [Rhizobium tibeticum]|uniref:Uncharacterized protein n=1 Tax=Rhizobium tibeticum TaxID=501024 RepID=A0A1H8W5V6_9HYPH|nr:hypothetical protein [Rhizobium tibeticum]SEI20403.1 hypothetical protein RTCCBAU85039_6385 [Rhizobium tibeticum]SEP22989.1 hypothetical protein SAMN05216228_10554 [Rhizobium tibeticum]